MRWLFVILGCGLVVTDRLLKLAALNGRSNRFGVFHFELFKNDALVFSWPAPNVVGIVIMFVAMIAVGWLGWRLFRERRTPGLVGAVLIFLGAASNLYDRLAYGYVIDWAYLGRWWPVFNLADVLIASGVLLMVFGPKRLTVGHR